MTMPTRIPVLSMGRTPTTVRYNPCVTPDVLDIVITKDLVTAVYRTTCSALSSGHLPKLIDKRCRSSFLNPLDRPDLRTDRSEFHACLEAGSPSNPDLPNVVIIDACQGIV